MRADVPAGSYAGAFDVRVTTDEGHVIKAAIHHSCLDLHREAWRRGMSTIEVIL